MAQYSGTYSCGHDGYVNVIGPHKDRQWKVDRAFSGLCPDCYEKYLQEQREKENAEAAEKAKEMELPELKGTEKQVAWGNTLRQKLIEKFDIDQKYFKMLKSIYDTDFSELKFENIMGIRDYILETKTEAKYYIDNRFDKIEDYVMRERKDALKTPEQKSDDKLLEEIKSESTVYPENKITDAVAEINVRNDKISIIAEKNETLRQIVKELGYSWDGAWERKISGVTGAAKDRAAEVGNKLLNAGFPVCILDEETRNKAIKGEYEPECNRWIMLRNNGDYAGQFAIKWWEKNDKLFRTAKMLPGAHWNNGSMVLKVWHYKEVEDFAKLYEFKFTKAALQAVEDYKNEQKNAEAVNPAKVEEIEPEDGLKKILNSGSEILDDLKD